MFEVRTDISKRLEHTGTSPECQIGLGKVSLYLWKMHPTRKHYRKYSLIVPRASNTSFKRNVGAFNCCHNEVAFL